MRQFPVQEKPDLAHYGVLGMKWGVRKDRGAQGVSRSTNRQAKKDAAEFTKAKMFYGEGAGTRRKLIKAKVEAATKKNPDYKKAFDHYVANTDLGKRASQAKRTRKRKDITGGTAKTARGVNRYVNGGFGSVSLASAVVGAGYLYAKQTGTDQILKQHGQRLVSDVLKNVRR